MNIFVLMSFWDFASIVLFFLSDGTLLFHTWDEAFMARVSWLFLFDRCERDVKFVRDRLRCCATRSLISVCGAAFGRAGANELRSDLMEVLLSYDRVSSLETISLSLMGHC